MTPVTSDIIPKSGGGQNSQPTMTRMSQSDFSMEPEQYLPLQSRASFVTAPGST